MSTDQMGVETLVVRILSSGNAEAQRQVCLALSFLASCPSRCLAVTFGAGIEDQLLQLVYNLSCNPDLTYPVLSAVASVSLVGKAMREKIVETELLHSWLVKLVNREDDESIMADACWTVACIARERCDCDLWDHVKEKLLHPIIDGLFYTTTNVRMVRAAVYVILKITEYGSSDQINDLVEMGGLEFLFYACSVKDVGFASGCFVAIENILKAGVAKADKDEDEEFEFEDEDEDEVENEYAKMIDGFSMGWDVIYMYTNFMTHSDRIVREAERLLEKYGPHPIPRWYKNRCSGW